MSRAGASYGPIRFGHGDLGGRARGLDFLARELGESLGRAYHPHRVVIDRPLVICSDVFERFVEENDLDQCVFLSDDQEIQSVFAQGQFPYETVEQIVRALREFDGPLELRSSTLREDNTFHPFSGVYHWEVLPNTETELHLRATRVLEAVKRVYASLYFRATRRILASLSTPIQEERMAVVVHRLRGQRHGELFYPTASGLAQGQNFFPVGPQQSREGICLGVMGYWSRSRSQDQTARFSPVRPRVRPELYRSWDALSHSQRSFFAVNLGQGAPVLELPLSQASDQALQYVASTWVREDDHLYPGTLRDGRRVVTFHPLLSGGMFPLAEVLTHLLDECRQLYRFPVELRFTLELARVEGKPRGELTITQALPQMLRADGGDVPIPDPLPGQPLLATRRVMGHGRVDGLKHILYVPPERMDRQAAVETALALARINDQLLERDEPALLIGPGRWGSSNPELGIPVTYAQIRAARAICEVASGVYNVAPSQGTHFFRNITLGNVFYLSIIEGEGDLVSAEWLSSCPAEEHGLVRHITLKSPATVVVDGMSGRGAAWIESG